MKRFAAVLLLCSCVTAGRPPPEVQWVDGSRDTGQLFACGWDPRRYDQTHLLCIDMEKIVGEPEGPPRHEL